MATPDPMHFDALAELYERARPAYPDALWSRLRELGALRTGDRAVDLGAGTGQATGPLLRAGLEVTAVEPGERLAARLRERYPAATVQVARAEDAVLAPGSFELAVAATSIHWMKREVVLPKVHHALTAGGRFAVWRNAYGDTSVAVTPFRERIEAIVARRDALERPGPSELETDRWARELTAGGHFAIELIEELRWSTDLDEQQVRGFFTTFSDWSPAEADEAAIAVRELGGLVTEHYVTPLIVLAKR